MTPANKKLDGRRVLYISYNGMLDPLGQSQVLPYLRELAAKGVRFTLLSFERSKAFDAEGERMCGELRATLATEHIEWHWLKYHQRPSLPATAYDILSGIRYGAKLVKRNRIEMVHARGQMAATIALRLKQRFGIKLIFDIRGLMAEEYFDAGHWRRNSIPYRLTKTMERRVLAAADGVVTLTERIWPIVKEWQGLRGREVVHQVIPCCTDLELFNFSQEDRDRRRAELNVSDRFVVVYSGSIDGWYLTERMADFFVSLLRKRPDAHFLWLTPVRHERLRDLMRSKGVDERDYTVIAATTQEMPSYLSAGDTGLAFIKPCFSKLASSPTKYAEYLACGLPLIINSGIGDSDFLVTGEGVGALLTDFTEQEFERAIPTIGALAAKAEETRKRTREVASRYFDVRGTGAERYIRLYEEVLDA